MLRDVEKKTCRDGDLVRYMITLMQVLKPAFEKGDILQDCDSY